MTNIVEQPRYYCALGAQQTVVAINKAVPILHSGPGCGVKLFRGLSSESGYQGVGYSGGSSIPCTNSTEREVVFGGEDRLREVIDGTLKVLKFELLVVLTGCTADIVGDDVVGSSLEKDLSEEFGYPLLNVSFPVTTRATLSRAYAGFRGGINLVEDLITLLVRGR